MNRVLLIVLMGNLLGSIWADADEMSVKNETISRLMDNDIRFQKPLYFCHMYSSDCDVFLLVNKNTLKTTTLSFKSENEQIFRINSIESCERTEQSTTIVDCPPMQAFRANDTTIEWNENDYSMYKINIYARLFGKARLLPLLDGHQIFLTTKNQTKSTLMVMLQPDRFVDKLLTIWVYIFQTIMSLIMGILIDPNTIVKIIKMPVAVVFGVACQYLMMPLVKISFSLH